MVLTFVLLIAPQASIPMLASMRIALITGVVAVAAYCWDRFVLRRPLIHPSLEMWTAGALLGWAVVTLPPRFEWQEALVGVLLTLFFKAIVVFFLLGSTVTTLHRLRMVTWGVSLMAVPLAATGVRNFVTLHAADVPQRIVGYVAGLTANPNDLAMTLNLILPLTLALFLVSRRPVVRTLLAGIIMLDVSAIIVTFSRGGFITLAIILVLYLRAVHGRREWKWAIVALALVLVAVPLLPQGYLDRLGTIINIRADLTGSAQLRVSDTQTALAFAASHPLGAGLGVNVLVLNTLRGWKTWQPVHNMYLVYAVDLGWPGLGLFLLLLASCIRRAAWVRDRCAGIPAFRELYTLAEAIRITLVAFAVAALFSPEAYHLYFYYFAALAVALGTVYESAWRAAAEGPVLTRAA